MQLGCNLFLGIFMKKILFFLTLLFATSAFAKLNTAVSILPQVTFVKAIGGEKVSVTPMIEPGDSPHTYEPKPSLMKTLSSANIYFSIGVEFEDAWLEKIFNQNKNILHVSLASNIEKIHIKEHGHDDHQHSSHDENMDPHIWTNPKNVLKMAKTIYTTLLETDPKNASYYKKNYLKFIKETKKLDADIKAILDEKRGSKFMVFHPSWGYFAKEYGLEQVAIETGGKKPKSKHIIEIIKEAEKENISAIITAPEFPENIAKQIAAELDIKVVAISPLAKNWSKNLLFLASTIANK